MEQGGESWGSYNYYTPDIIGANKCEITTKVLKKRTGQTSARKFLAIQNQPLGTIVLIKQERKYSLKRKIFSYPLGPTQTSRRDSSICSQDQ